MKRSVVAGMVLLPLSLGAMLWFMTTAGETVRPVVRDDVGAALSRAARAAQGQRVLVIAAKPGTTPSGTVYDSWQVPGGWGAFEATADPADPLVPALGALAKTSAEEFARDARFSAATTRALGLFGVAVVLVTDGTNVLMPDPGERDPNVGVACDVPALRIRHAEPVFLLLAEQADTDPADPVEFARRLRYGDADMRGVEDQPRWGGDVVVEAAGPSQFLLSWPAHGARVTVDGGPAEYRAARVPMLVVSTPAGRHTISVRYGEPDMNRQALLIATAFVVVASLLAIVFGLRPQVPPAEGASA